jgi:hypothetical protein
VPGDNVALELVFRSVFNASSRLASWRPLITGRLLVLLETGSMAELRASLETASASALQCCQKCLEEKTQ